jgi:hypothetical protein
MSEPGDAALDITSRGDPIRRSGISVSAPVASVVRGEPRLLENAPRGFWA